MRCSLGQSHARWHIVAGPSPENTIIIHHICDIRHVLVTPLTLNILDSYLLPLCLCRLWSKLQHLNDASVTHGILLQYFNQSAWPRYLVTSCPAIWCPPCFWNNLTSDLVELPALITASLVGPASVITLTPLFTPPSIVPSVASPVISPVIPSVVSSSLRGLRSA